MPKLCGQPIFCQADHGRILQAPQAPASRKSLISEFHYIEYKTEDGNLGPRRPRCPAASTSLKGEEPHPQFSIHQ